MWSEVFLPVVPIFEEHHSESLRIFRIFHPGVFTIMHPSFSSSCTHRFHDHAPTLGSSLSSSLLPMREWTRYASEHKERSCSAGVAGKIRLWPLRLAVDAASELS